MLGVVFEMIEKYLLKVESGVSVMKNLSTFGLSREYLAFINSICTPL